MDDGLPTLDADGNVIDDEKRFPIAVATVAGVKRWFRHDKVDQTVAASGSDGDEPKIAAVAENDGGAVADAPDVGGGGGASFAKYGNQAVPVDKIVYN